LEISLRPFQFCNLVTINAGSVQTQEELNARARAATFIATLQASYTDFHYLRDIWRRTTEREALIGVSMTGIASGTVMKLDQTEAANVVLEENARVAKILGINSAARTTTLKPEGCLSLDTTIRTSEGVVSVAALAAQLTNKNIFELPEGTWIDVDKDIFIFNENNQQEKISKLYINGISPVFEITTEDGNVVKLTSEHRLKTTTGWKHAKDLQIGEDIISF
jgi:hypothetical protein